MTTHTQIPRHIVSAISAFVLVWGMFPTTYATNTNYLNFQGRLLMSATTPAANFTFNLRLSMWDDEDYVSAVDIDPSGVLVGASWQEVQTLTTDSQGFFVAKVGLVTPLPEFDPAIHRYIQGEVKQTTASNTTYYLLDNKLSDASIDRKSILDSAYAQNALRLNGHDTGTDAGDIPFLNAEGKLSRALLEVGTWLDPVADTVALASITGMTEGSLVFVESENSLYVYQDSAWAKMGTDMSYDEVNDKYNFGGSRVSNIGGPTEANDAATKDYVDTLFAERAGGGTYLGITALTNFTGNISGYTGGDAACRVDYPGSHVCQTDEIIATISARDISTLFTYTNLAGAWILEGAPGYTAPANDCNGLKDGTSSYLGAFWQFDPTTGGTGQLSICSQTKPFACCK
jgi:hypothetical protein